MSAAAFPDPAALVAANSYLTLATVDPDGRPWATPVWFAPDGDGFLWASRPEARHSRNIATTPAVGIVVFDSTAPPGQGTGFYADAEAAEVAPGDVAAAVAAYSAGCVAAGLPGWTEARVTGPAQFRLYRARMQRAWVLDDHDRRVPVQLWLPR